MRLSKRIQKYLGRLCPLHQEYRQLGENTILVRLTRNAPRPGYQNCGAAPYGGFQMRRFLLTATLLLAAAPTAAQDEPNAFRRWDINFNLASFARTEGQNARGAQFGFAFRFSPTVGIVADFGGHQNSEAPSITLYAYRFGPRLYGHYGRRVTAFGHFLVGAGRIEDSMESGGVTTTRSVDGFSTAFGGGLDVAIRPWFAIRVGQLDYEYFRFQGEGGDGIRAGAGIVFRIGKP
jgi:hypothetical protein